MTQNVLSNKGKEKLFRALEEYVDAKIIQNTRSSRFWNWVTGKSGLDDRQKKLDKATNELKEMIMALEIETTGVKQ